MAATGKIAITLLALLICCAGPVVKADEDRLYSESVGQACLNGDELDEVTCEDEETCFVECSEKCDSNEDCDSFMVEGDSCMRYEGCDEIMQDDNCTSCSVHVCLDNCPDEAEDYFTVNGTTVCKRKTRIGRVNMDCEDDEFDECVEDCAELCEDNEKCTDFTITENKKCFLYEGCREKTVKKGTAILGTIRERSILEPKKASSCGVMFTNWAKKPDDGATFYKSRNSLEKCFKACDDTDIITASHESGNCFCWKEGTGEWKKTFDDSSFIVGACGLDTDDLPDRPDDEDDEVDGCVSVYKNWVYVGRGDESAHETHDPPTVQCLKKCPRDDIVVGVDGECECWKEGKGAWEKKKRSTAFIRETCEEDED